MKLFNKIHTCDFCDMCVFSDSLDSLDSTVPSESSDKTDLIDSCGDCVTLDLEYALSILAGILIFIIKIMKAVPNTIIVASP